MSSQSQRNIITTQHLMNDISVIEAMSCDILNSKKDNIEHCLLTDISCMASSFYSQIQGKTPNQIVDCLSENGIEVSYSLPEHCSDVDVKGVIFVNHGSHKILLPRDIENSNEQICHLFMQLGNLFTHEHYFNKDKTTSSIYVDSKFCQDDYASKNEQAGFFALRLMSLFLKDQK